MTESENGAVSSLFECSGCEGRETVEDSEQESDGHAAGEVVRSCKRCGSATTWKRLSNGEIQRESGVESPVAASEVTVKSH
jgi:hypothetical protein